MIQQLELLISTCHPEEFPSAEAILNCVEEAGMLPPEDANKSFQMLPSGEMVYNVNEWEPE